MNFKDVLSEEFAITGWRHGKLSHKMTPLFEGDKELKDLKDVLYDGKIFLKPANNKFDKNAVEVFTAEQQHLGYVWSGQAAALRSWIEENDATYVVAYIKKADKVAEVFIAEPQKPFHLDIRKSLDRNIDEHWAENLPDQISCVEVESHSLGMSLLRDELKVAKEWTPMLQKYIDNAFKHLPVDYSANRFVEDIEVCNMMASSEIEEVRKRSSILLKKLVKRGNKNQIQWWVDEWLPGLFQQAAEEKLLEMFLAAGYTLERVESLLNQAPEGLFYLYKCDKIRFGKHLLYSYLPIYIYGRLLTLLAVRELMLGKAKEQQDQIEEEEKGKKDYIREVIGNVIRQLWDENELKRMYDYTWVMIIMNENEELPTFDTPTSFVEYLSKYKGKIRVPARSTISRYYSTTKGHNPNWTFDDADDQETIRRNNIGKRFLKLFLRAIAH